MKTIEEIKSITDTRNSLRIKAQIPEIEKAIEKEASDPKGLSYLIWEKELFTDTIKHLQSSGYEVFTKEDIIGDDIYKITWNL